MNVKRFYSAATLSWPCPGCGQVATWNADGGDCLMYPEPGEWIPVRAECPRDWDASGGAGSCPDVFVVGYVRVRIEVDTRDPTQPPDLDAKPSLTQALRDLMKTKIERFQEALAEAREELASRALREGYPPADLAWYEHQPPGDMLDLRGPSEAPRIELRHCPTETVLATIRLTHWRAELRFEAQWLGPTRQDEKRASREADAAAVERGDLSPREVNEADALGPVILRRGPMGKPESF